jgi:hypothetical protein
MSCRITEYQRQQWRLQEQQRQEQAAREQQRVAQTKNAWAQVTTARANATLAGYQQRAYGDSVQRLFALSGMYGNNKT